MAHRIEGAGRLIDRARPLDFTWNGEPLKGYAGDTLASALLGADKVLVGRSFKYHRPRGIVASGVEEPNALVGLGRGGRFEPNARATTTELFQGLEARSQNHWPSLEFDVGAVNGALASLAPLFPAGFYYKTFIHPRAAWKHVFEPVIRNAAGLGRAPEAPDEDSYEHFHAFADVLVVGGGPAGLTAARAAAEAGARVLLAEQAPHLGGRALVEEGVTVGGASYADWAAEQVAAIAAMRNAQARTRMVCAGLYDHGFAILEERLTDHAPGAGGPRRRLWKVRARRIIVAAGAIERPIAFACNDVPGVMLASAVRDYLALYGVAPGRRLALFTVTDDAYRTAIVARAHGIAVTVLDARVEAGPLARAARAAGADVRFGVAVTRALGGKRLEGVEFAPLKDGSVASVIEADALGMSGGWSPTGHLFSHAGGKLRWDDALIAFRPDAGRAAIGADGAANTLAAGSADGAMETAAALHGARAAGLKAAAECGFSGAAAEVGVVDAAADSAPAALWRAPGRGKHAHGSKHFIDFQNDVTAADVALAAREGYQSVEHAKRYTTLGMATDQGKLSNINGLALLADALNAPIPQVGTTTFRPPYQPIALGAVAGAATGPLFKPVRKTPMHGWHETNGAVWEPVGDWRRPYAYPRPGESRHDAINREIAAVRGGVAVLDASTLGKIVVKGPDAAAFLDRVYTNVMSSLPVGRCRYGLMCNDNGFLFDDGVVARLAEDEFLLHTTSGGSDRVHAWLEEWLQTEWPDLRVFTANVTEQWAQIAVAGPLARAALQALGCDIDLANETFRFF
jgi:sarcosine oxidase subunit alpha